MKKIIQLKVAVKVAFNFFVDKIKQVVYACISTVIQGGAKVAVAV